MKYVEYICFSPQLHYIADLVCSKNCVFYYQHFLLVSITKVQNSWLQTPDSGLQIFNLTTGRPLTIFCYVHCQHQYFYVEFIWQTAPKYAACDNSSKFTWSKVYSYNQYNANTFSTKTRSLLIVHTLRSPNTAPSTILYVVHAIRITKMCSLIWSTKAEMQIQDCWFICFLFNVATLILLLRVDLLQYNTQGVCMKTVY